MPGSRSHEDHGSRGGRRGRRVAGAPQCRGEGVADRRLLLVCRAPGGRNGGERVPDVVHGRFHKSGLNESTLLREDLYSVSPLNEYLLQIKRI